MSKAMRRLKGKELTTVDNLAHVFVVADISRNVPGFGGLLDHYLENSASVDQRRQWHAFQERVKELQAELAAEYATPATRKSS